ncbi:MAG TPA: DUF1801 domain-containing protein [Allosphingosinicella sp.]|jgi:hypothetical protein
MSVEALLSRCDPSVADIAAAVRELLFDALPGVEETADESANVIGYGYGPGYKGLIATIIPSKKGVKLGLTRGASLPDPEGLLAGAGKVHRYVEVPTPDAARRPGVRALVEAAKAAFEAG